MRTINVTDLIPIVKQLCMEANCSLGKDVIAKIREFRAKENSPTGKEVLGILLENYKLAARDRMPICQDTGTAVFFVELGQDVQLTGGNFTEAIDEGVRQGYEAGYLRKSIVENPLFGRNNTNDNTPAVIHTTIVPGENIKITFAPKGGGAENMSAVKMLKPADGLAGVKDFVVDVVRRAGANPCPPIIVGVGIGGNFEECTLLSKKSLLRSLSEDNPDPQLAELERDLLQQINNLGIGPQGFGGNTTALAVHILSAPCHIASLPVAVNLQCHAARHKSVIL
ncbi:MAG TPA: fumarate hydratase [Candidatus Cloacimonadota bacterium]|nr:fumarate hydratase [Candidatus Cloacimonadota bacterium]